MTENKLLHSSLLSAALLMAGCDAGVLEGDSVRAATVEPTRAPILNGSTTGFPETVTALTVYINSANPGFMCTGVIVAPRVVLTARHCTTSNGEVLGPDGVFTDMSIEKNGTTRGVAAGARHPSLDVAVLFFSDVLTPMVTWDYTYFPAPYAALWQSLPPIDDGGTKAHYTVDGYGTNTCSDGIGTERWGTVEIAAFPDIDRIRTAVHTSNQLGWMGDSGSGLWDTVHGRSADLAGIQSTGLCTYNATTGSYAGSRSTYVATSSIYAWVNGQIYDYMASIGRSTQLWSTGTALAAGNAWMALPTCSNTWTTSGNEMHQTSNCGAGDRGNLWVFSDVSMTTGAGYVQVTSNDNDDQGMAFRIQDRDNYYYVAANRQNSTLGIYKMVGGVRYTLWQRSMAIDFSTWRWIGFSAMGNAFQVYWDGTWYGYGYDFQTGGPKNGYGGVGLWENYQSTAKFRNAQLQHMR